MEKQVDKVIFRRITDYEFHTINQPGSAYPGGGGQSYIDIPTGYVPLADWNTIVGPPTGTRAQNRPYWDFNIESFGQNNRILLTVAQRRNASVMITSQKKEGRGSNRVPAWHPDHSTFPDYPLPAGQRNPLVYIVKTTDGEFWAGWTDRRAAEPNWYTNAELDQLFTSDEAGKIVCDGSVFVETNNPEWPFLQRVDTPKHHTRTEEEVIHIEFEEDVLEDVDTLPPEEKERVIKIRARNTKIVRNLKRLYSGRCQISGEELTFQKKDGELYSEAHHLIALGDGGSDDYRNIIIISPLIHRMLHYAQVSEIDLSKIENNQLTIQINSEDYTITWHPEHARTVEKSVEDEQ